MSVYWSPPAGKEEGIPIPQNLEEQIQATTSSHHARKKGRQWLKMLKKRQSNVVMDEMETPPPTLHHDDDMNKIVIDGAAVSDTTHRCMGSLVLTHEVIGFDT